MTARGAFFGLLVAVVAGFGTTALAFDTDEPLDDPALAARYERLTEELRCLVCQNQNIADSPVQLAVDLRTKVRSMLLEGKTDKEILDYMVERYGDFVRYKPPWAPRTWALWLSPLVLLLFGGWLVAGVLRRHSAPAVETTEEDGIGV